MSPVELTAKSGFVFTVLPPKCPMAASSPSLFKILAVGLVGASGKEAGLRGAEHLLPRCARRHNPQARAARNSAGRTKLCHGAGENERHCSFRKIVEDSKARIALRNSFTLLKAVAPLLRAFKKRGVLETRFWSATDAYSCHAV